jgi:hypothetical protein
VKLPFSRSQFLDVFAAYNGAVGPVALLLWAAAAALAIRMLGRRPPGGRVVAAYLALLWAWTAVVYHGLYFRRINPAAIGFALLYAVEAAILAGLAAFGRGLRPAAYGPRRLNERPGASWRAPAGAAFLVFALAYPLAAFAAGELWPRLPTFGVPCPTVLYTAGVFLRRDFRLRELASAVPFVWSVFGGSAALFLGMIPDYSLWLAAAAIAVDVVVTRRARRTSG